MAELRQRQLLSFMKKYPDASRHIKASINDNLDAHLKAIPLFRGVSGTVSMLLVPTPLSYRHFARS